MSKGLVIACVKKAPRWTWLCLAIIVSAGCASSGPQTTFYSLFAKSYSPSETTEISKPGFSLGVGPVVFPDYIDNPSIVSVTSGQRVRVSGYHAWSGDFNRAFTRVLADDISSLTNVDRVWGFPWDNRVRPEYQARVVVEEFSGIRGGEIVLNVKWTLLNKTADKVLLVGKERLTQSTATDSIGDYVVALNQLTNALSLVMAEKIQGYISTAH